MLKSCVVWHTVAYEVSWRSNAICSLKFKHSVRSADATPAGLELNHEGMERTQVYIAPVVYNRRA